MTRFYPFMLPVLAILLFSCNTQPVKNAEKAAFRQTVATPQPGFPLPSELQETSGLIYSHNLFWTFNDSGGENILYGVDRNGNIQAEVTLNNARNVDWEDIAQDSAFIYLADAGNNNGNRTDLVIYRISKAQLTPSGKSAADADLIRFSFEDQQTFGYLPRTTPFDCEALVATGENLYLFTKNWADETTTVYRLPAQPGEHTARRTALFEVNGLVTGADLAPSQQKLALSGYKNFRPFVWVFSQFEEDNFFSGEAAFFDLEPILDAQTEGICFVSEDSLAISCERTNSFREQIFWLPLDPNQPAP